jgi:glycosyltransferase involved in cell wall biosynthesis
MAQLAAPLAERGWHTLVVTTDEPGSGVRRMRSAGVEVCQIPLHRLRAKKDLRAHVGLLAGLPPEIAHLRRIIHEQQIDLVQVVGLMNPHGGIAARMEGVPLVWQILGTTAPMPLRRLLMPLVVRLADVLMITGRRVAQAHPGALSLGARLVLFAPPVAPRYFEQHADRRAAARAELGIPPDALLLGTVGNRNRLKGHDVLVQAAALLHAQYPHVVTRILGAATTHAADYERTVVDEARALGMLDGERLRFVEPGERVAELLPAFDIFLLTSRREGVPTVILEAMAGGLPVVACDVGAVREVVEHGVTGFLVPANDPAAVARAVRPLIERPALRQQMGESARQRAHERYTLRHCVDTHVYAYELAVRHHAARAGKAGNL